MDGHWAPMRQRIGLEPDDNSRDDYIRKMSPRQKLEHLCGWYLGDPTWSSNILGWAKAAGYEVKEPR